MTTLKCLVFLGILGLSTLQSGFATAASTTVLGRKYSPGCGYYTQTIGDLQLTYESRELPWGTQVDLIAGWEGREIRIENGERKDVSLSWFEEKTYEAKAVGEYIWQIELSRTLHERGSPRVLWGLNFVWKITLPSGEQIFEKGNSTPLGYYRVKFNEGLPCAPEPKHLPKMEKLDLVTVEKGN